MATSTLHLAPYLADDPVILHRNDLLDSELMGEQFARHLGELGVIDSCEIRRVKYRLGESLRVVYHLRTRTRTEIVSLRTFPSSGWAEVVRRQRQRWPQPTRSGLPSVAGLPEMNAVMWCLPADRRLGQLDALINPPASWSAITGGRWTSSELVEYAPERSATARMTDEVGLIVGFAKAYRSGTATGLAERYRSIAHGLQASPDLDSPHVLDWREHDDVLLLEAMPGVAWDRLSPERAERALGQLGRAIATVHRLPCETLTPFRRLQPARVAHSAELIAQARPDVAERCRQLANLLARPLPTDGRPDVFLHGDVHPGNSLFTDEGISLLDFDQAARGQAAADIGSLIARLRFGVWVGEFSADHGRRLIARFLDDYAAVERLPGSEVLRAHVAAALVAERGLRLINRVRTSALPHLASMLTDALDLLNGQPCDEFT